MSSRGLSSSPHNTASSVSPGQSPNLCTSPTPVLSRTTPLPQSQWERVPEAYRPKDWMRSSATTDQPLPHSPPGNDSLPLSSFSIRQQPQSSQGQSTSSWSSLSRRKQRHEHSASSSNRPSFPGPSTLHPHSGPYDHPTSSCSEPDDFAYAWQASAPQGLGRRPSSVYSWTSPSNASLPRAPTYPPATNRRARSASRNDIAFQDEEEFRLFIDATIGLGPIPSFSQGPLAESPAFATLEQNARPPLHVSQPHRQESVVSPFSDTPTTRAVLQDLAQMPQHRSASPQQPSPPRYRDRTERRPRSDSDDEEEGLPIDISDSGLGVFSGHIPAPPNNDWLDTDTPMHDDELPSYATSQAEAHAARRQAAARRAEELQRRWREGGRKYGSEH